MKLPKAAIGLNSSSGGGGGANLPSRRSRREVDDEAKKRKLLFPAHQPATNIFKKTRLISHAALIPGGLHALGGSISN